MEVSLSFDSEVTFKRVTSSLVDAIGGDAETIENVICSAKVDHVKMNEGESEGASYTGEKIKVTVYYRNWIDSKVAMEYRGEAYDIVSIAEIDRNHYLEIIAEKKD